jgi:hypothetical protein
MISVSSIYRYRMDDATDEIHPSREYTTLRSGRVCLKSEIELNLFTGSASTASGISEMDMLLETTYKDGS